MLTDTFLMFDLIVKALFFTNAVLKLCSAKGKSHTLDGS